jgi:signal transduction histidine kinase
MVLARALVEGIRLIEPNHVQIRTHMGTTQGTIQMLTSVTNLPLPFKEGDYIRLKAVYVPAFNRDNQLEDFNLWVAKREDIVVTGSLAGDPRFAIPITPSEKIADGLPDNRLIRVQGVVRSHDPGKWLTIWDDTGQVSAKSSQTSTLQPGDKVDVLGYPYVTGIQLCLRDAVFRVVAKAPLSDLPVPSAPAIEPIRLAARIQNLSHSEAEHHPTVSLRGVLLWSHPDSSFIYVEDGSGGVRVVNPVMQETNMAPGSIVTVRGEVALGDYVPIVTNAVVSRVGWRGFDLPRPMSLEQALIGADEGRWVQMRGYVRAVSPVGRLTRLTLSTSMGEFNAWTSTSSQIDSLLGTIVRIDGVCSGIADSRHQLVGIELWLPDPVFIRIDEQETKNVFGAEFRPLESLRQFGGQNDLSRRVKTEGTVVLQRPGRYLYLQDGSYSVFALSRQPEQLQPGDRVQVVGFPGNEHGKYLLREVVFRRLSGGKEPDPVPLTGVEAVNVELGGQLAKAEGVLINTILREDRARLLIRRGGSTFEASMEAVNAATAENFGALKTGCKLALKGVYEVQNDEYGRPSSFILLLRSWDDIKVTAQPPWWTMQRLLTLLLMVLVVFLVALLWALVIARKNALLRQAQSRLELANKELESFSYSVSHDLRAPLRSIDGFSRALLEDYQDRLDDEGKENLQIVRAASQRMEGLIDDMLRLSQINRCEMRWTEVNLSQMAEEIAKDLRKSDPARQAEFVIAPHCVARGDAALLRIALENILNNAWKYTGKRPSARIEFGVRKNGEEPVCFVSDNGCGFDMKYADKLFGAFQRLHAAEDFPGTGVGLASVRRVIQRHGGQVWIEGKVEKGTTVYFRIPNIR